MLENRKIDWIFDYLFEKEDCSKELKGRALEIKEEEREQIKKHNLAIKKKYGNL